MKHQVGGILVGALFAIGLALSGMTDPAKVVAFLDVTGRWARWDPTLAFVMAGAIAMHAPFVRLARARATPIAAPVFHAPAATRIDPAVVLGSALFGIGWGLSGYCPGPALVSLGRGSPGLFVFVGAMIAGIAGTRYVLRVTTRRAA